MKVSRRVFALEVFRHCARRGTKPAEPLATTVNLRYKESRCIKSLVGSNFNF